MPHVKNSIEIFYLNEDIWMQRDGWPFIQLDLVFRAKKGCNRFFVLFHGKPEDPRRSEFRKEGHPQKNNVIVSSKLSIDQEYVEKEGWRKGFSQEGADEVKIEEIPKKISVVGTKNGDLEFEWDEEFEECSALLVQSKRRFKANHFYDIRLAVYLRPPQEIKYLSLRSRVRYFLHYCTLRGVSDSDRAIIAKRFGSFAPTYTRMPKGELPTSTLFLYYPISHKMIAAKIQPGRRGERSFRPLSHKSLSPPWEFCSWSANEFRLNKITPKLDFKRPKSEKEPLEVTIERYDPLKKTAEITIFLALLGILFPVIELPSAILLSYAGIIIVHEILKRTLWHETKGI